MLIYYLCRFRDIFFVLAKESISKEVNPDEAYFK